MNATVTLTILLLFLSDILTSLEQKLDAGFNEETYQRYLYYCRQQNAGERLVERSTLWLKLYPDQEILRFGEAEGLLMSGKTQDGINKFEKLYEDSDLWGNEIIFILKELNIPEITWFIEKERNRYGNPTLYTQIMVENYIRQGNERKALDEIASALKSGQSPHAFRQSLDKLTLSMGTEKVLEKLKDASPQASFQLAIELRDKNGIENAILDIDNERDLVMMGHQAEQGGYLDQALLAYQRSGRKADAARILALTGKEKEALAMLEGDNTREGLEQQALLYACSNETYDKSLKAYKELESRYGINSIWNIRIATLYLLKGDEKKADEYLRGIAPDSSTLLLKGILAIINDNMDSLKQHLDKSLMIFSGNAYENDLILLYNLALKQSSGIKEYSFALAAYYWGDTDDAYRKSMNLAEQANGLSDEGFLLAAESLARLGRWKEAESVYIKLADCYPESPLSPRAKFERALLLKNHLDSPGEAREILKDIIITDPTSLYADLARREM